MERGEVLFNYNPEQRLVIPIKNVLKIVKVIVDKDFGIIYNNPSFFINLKGKKKGLVKELFKKFSPRKRVKRTKHDIQIC